MTSDARDDEEQYKYKKTADRFTPSYVPGYEDYVPEDER